jgi:hypothetical protein
MPDSINHPLNMLEILDGVPLPATKQELIDYAQDHDASEDMLDQLQAMPGDTFNSISDINRHIGLVEDMPGSENLWSSADSRDLPDDSEIAATQSRGQGRI